MKNFHHEYEFICGKVQKGRIWKFLIVNMMMKQTWIEWLFFSPLFLSILEYCWVNEWEMLEISSFYVSILFLHSLLCDLNNLDWFFPSFIVIMLKWSSSGWYFIVERIIFAVKWHTLTWLNRLADSEDGRKDRSIKATLNKAWNGSCHEITVINSWNSL